MTPPVRPVMSDDALRRAGFTPQEIADYQRRQQGGAPPVRAESTATPGAGRAPSTPILPGLVRSATQGFLLGGADELGLVDREADRAFAAEHPILSAGARMVGAAAPFVAGPLAPGALAARGAFATVPRAIATGAAIGGATGAVSGALEAEPGQRTAMGAVGGVMGTVLGGGIPGVVGGAKALFQPAGKTAQGIIKQAADRAGGEQALLNRVDQFRRTGRANDITVMDLGRPMVGVADLAANNSDVAADRIAPVLLRRQSDVRARMLGDVQDVLQTPALPNAARATESLAEGTRAWAGGPAGYEGLRQANPDLSAITIKMRLPGGGVVHTQTGQELQDILRQPQVVDAFRRANRTGLIGDTPDLGNPSFQKLQDVKEAMDDLASSAFRAGNGNEGTRLAQSRDALVQWMTTNVPGYSGVAEEYARRKGLEKAIELGQDFWTNPDSRGLVDLVAKLRADNPRELLSVRYGLASEFVAKLRGSEAAANPAAQIMKVLGGDVAQSAQPGTMGSALLDKLRIIFDSPQEFGQFLERATIEAQMADPLRAIGGSQTAKRLSASNAAALADLATDMAGFGASWGASGALSALTRFASTAARKMRMTKVGEELASPLTIRGADNVERFIRDLYSTRPPALAGPVSTAAGAVGTRGFLDFISR
jgi:hypothetical protein